MDGFPDRACYNSPQEDLTLMTYFREGSDSVTRAIQIWLILIGLAATRQTITYPALAKAMGYKY